MSRRIAIVGAGQAGLELGLALLERDYQVTMLSNRTAEQIEQGKVMSSQCMFHDALETERALGINFWEGVCPGVEGIGFSVPHPTAPGVKAIEWAARLDHPAQAVDQRIKMAGWLREFERRGGHLQIREATLADLEQLAERHDLVLLAAGKGDIVKLFERDALRSTFDQPQRALALTYVHGMRPMSAFSRVCFNLIPGVGEYFAFPALTASGPCEIMVFEGIPGGPMDCWSDVSTPQQHLQRSLEILMRFLPWEAERCRNIELTDANGILAGRFAPTVRHPVAVLPSGKLIFGIADAVVVNDPITGQGSNNAAKCSKVVLDTIAAHGDRAFDRDWMETCFAAYWNYAKDVVCWTNTLLTPPPPHILKLLASAQQCAPLASLIANGFNNPPDFFPWWLDPEQCDALIARKMAEA